MGPQAKRRKTSKVEEITFDHSARHEFLTGFRKRKQQRIKQAQEVAEQKAREMKREERKRVRHSLIVHLSRNTFINRKYRFGKNEKQSSKTLLRSIRNN